MHVLFAKKHSHISLKFLDGQHHCPLKLPPDGLRQQGDPSIHPPYVEEDQKHGVQRPPDSKVHTSWRRWRHSHGHARSLKMVVTKDIEREEIEFLSKTLNCKPISNIEAFTVDKLGYTDLLKGDSQRHQEHGPHRERHSIRR